MRRRLFTFISAGSLLLCVGVCVLWARSYRTADFWFLEAAPTRDSVRSMSGEIGYLRQTSIGAPPPTVTASADFRHFTEEAEGPMTAGFADQQAIWNRLGFACAIRQRTVTGTAGMTTSFVVVPFWALFLVTAVLPATTLATIVRGRSRRQRLRRGLCPSCGYDLRASPERCPECGAMPARYNMSDVRLTVHLPFVLFTILTASAPAIAAETATVKYLGLLEGFGGRSVCFSLDGGKILTAGDAAVQVWDAKTYKPIGQPIEFDAGVKFAQFDGGADKVLVLRNDAAYRQAVRRRRTTTGEATLLDAATGKRLLPAILHGDQPVADADLSPDGTLVATSNEMDDTVRVWDATTGKERAALKHERRVKGVRFAPSGKVLLVSAGSANVLWDANTWKEGARLPGWPFSSFGGAPAAAFSADGRRVAVVTDKEFGVYDTETGVKLADNEPHNLHLDEVTEGVAISADGSRVVTTSTRGAMLWDARDGKPLLQSEEDVFRCPPAMSPDGSHLLTRGPYRPQLLDVASGRRAEFPLNSGANLDVASFSPDGKVLAVGTYDGHTAIFAGK